MNWVQCDNCDKWLHTPRECLSPGEEVNVSKIDIYVCLKCRDMREDDLIGILKDKVTDNLAEEDDLKATIVEQGILCDDLKARNEETMGPRELELNRKLEEIKVTQQAYHGNIFVGNHCKLVLRNYETICNVVADQPVCNERFMTIFSLFNEIQRLLFVKSRLLTEEEINKLSQDCHKFGEIFTTLFPETNVMRKIHELVFSVPRFVRHFKTKVKRQKGICAKILSTGIWVPRAPRYAIGMDAKSSSIDCLREIMWDKTLCEDDKFL